MTTVTILGAGSWGLTLAWLACGPEKTVRLWDRKPEKIEALRRDRQVTFPVNVRLQDEIQLTDSLVDAVRGADVILLVVTSSGTREVIEAMIATGELSDRAMVVNASKGIEYPSLKTMSAIMEELLPDNPRAVISGPTLAPEILKGLPTAAVIASRESGTAESLQHLLTTDLFRLYTNTDVVGVELGGSLKNIFAIVSGYMEAKALGANARSTLITRGLAEITRFSVAFGADVQTLYGLSGLGDLLATCTSPLSRNYQVGYRLAQGKTLEQVLDELKMVAEGVKTTHAVSRMSDRFGIDMPVVKQVEMALTGKFAEHEIIHTLMSRKLKAENIQSPSSL